MTLKTVYLHVSSVSMYLLAGALLVFVSGFQLLKFLKQSILLHDCSFPTVQACSLHSFAMARLGVKVNMYYIVVLSSCSIALLWNHETLWHLAPSRKIARIQPSGPRWT